MSVTLQNVSYSPSAYVFENGGQLNFKWDTVLTPPPASFTWQIDLLKSDGVTVWQTIGPFTQPVAGGITTVSTTWTPPSSPPLGGVIPRWTIDAGATGTLVQSAGNGITARRSFATASGDGAATVQR